MISAWFFLNKDPPCPEGKDRKDNDADHHAAVIGRRNRKRERECHRFIAPLIIVGDRHGVGQVPVRGTAQPEEGGGIVARLDLAQECFTVAGEGEVDGCLYGLCITGAGILDPDDQVERLARGEALGAGLD